MKISTTFKIFNVVKRPLRFLDKYGEKILLITILSLLIYMCNQLN